MFLDVFIYKHKNFFYRKEFNGLPDVEHVKNHEYLYKDLIDIYNEGLRK